MKTSRFFRSLCLAGAVVLLFVEAAAAAPSYDLKEMTPEVEKALEGRKARYATLQGFKGRGFVGETNKGYIEILDALTEAGQAVADENRDRKLIYEAIVAQNHLGPESIAEVRRIFAEVQRGKAQPGDLIQLPSGEWIKKK